MKNHRVNFLIVAAMLLLSTKARALQFIECTLLLEDPSGVFVSQGGIEFGVANEEDENPDGPREFTFAAHTPTSKTVGKTFEPRTLMSFVRNDGAKTLLAPKFQGEVLRTMRFSADRVELANELFRPDYFTNPTKRIPNEVNGSLLHIPVDAQGNPVEINGQPITVVLANFNCYRAK